MTHVQRWPGEPIDDLVRRFRQAILKSGVVGEARRRRYFLSPSEKRRAKSAAAERRRARSRSRLRRAA